MFDLVVEHLPERADYRGKSEDHKQSSARLAERAFSRNL